jgi:hypothetical protein
MNFSNFFGNLLGKKEEPNPNQPNSSNTATEPGTTTATPSIVDKFKNMFAGGKKIKQKKQKKQKTKSKNMKKNKTKRK